MDQAMNKYTLIFYDQKVEEQYQSQSTQKRVKPLFYAQLFMALLLNIIQLIVAYFLEQRLPIINLIFTSITIMNLLVIYKKDKYTQLSIALENACILLLQLNFNTSTSSQQDFFSFGSNFALIQAAVYFVSDFTYSFPSVIIHLAFRFSANSFIDKKFSVVNLGLTLSAGAFLSSVLYVCHKAQRMQFLMSIKQDEVDNQLKLLINKPFFKFKFDQKKIMFDIKLHSMVNKLKGFNNEYCESCNCRQYLRDSLYMGKPIELLIIDKKLPLNQSILLQYKKTKVSTRICEFTIDNSFIIILEQIIIEQIQNKIPSKIVKDLKSQFKLAMKSKFNQQFQYGVLSILNLGQFDLHTINIAKLIKKFVISTNLKKMMEIQLKNKIDMFRINTYYHQVVIFFIQIFNILNSINEYQNQQGYLEIQSWDICISLKIILPNPLIFFSLYQQNFFIQETSKKILLCKVTEDLDFNFSKLLPYDSQLEQY